MRPDAGVRLYFPLDRTYRRRATRPQIALMVVALALSVGAIAAHYLLVFRPSQMDFTLASMPYEPWYLVQEEAIPAMEPRAPAESHEAAASRAGLLPVAMPAQSVEPARPNLAPQTGVSYTPSGLTGKIGAYLKSKGAGASKEDMANKALQLAQTYASSAGTGNPAFPFHANLERSVLEQGWLWDVREGCDPQMYLKFPAGQLDKMGCGLPDIPAGKPFGVGVALVREEGAEGRPTIAVVWENK